MSVGWNAEKRQGAEDLNALEEAPPRSSEVSSQLVFFSYFFWGEAKFQGRILMEMCGYLWDCLSLCVCSFWGCGEVE